MRVERSYVSARLAEEVFRLTRPPPSRRPGTAPPLQGTASIGGQAVTGICALRPVARRLPRPDHTAAPATPLQPGYRVDNLALRGPPHAGARP
jgi:hypothetical protein